MGPLTSPQLNMWQRLGVVASVLWVGLSLVWDHHIYEKLSSDSLDVAIRACETLNNINAAECYVRDLVEFRKPGVFRVEFLLNAIVPIASGWALAYLLIWIARWVLAGRKVSN